MFYLGSIAGILPYILAFSLTLVWGGHAGLPFFVSGSTPETKNVIAKEENIPVEKLKSFAYHKQVITRKIDIAQIPSFTRTKVLSFYLVRFVDCAVLGISLLRAPPSLFFIQ
jgi:hypothetical protein